MYILYFLLAIFVLLFSFLVGILFYIRFSSFPYIPTLMYHRIATIPNDRNSLPPEKFAWQMAFLARQNYHTITPQELYAYYVHQKPLPPRSVLLTFDDAYRDVFDVALPILKKYNFSALVFPISNWIGRENAWENFHKAPTTTMTWSDLKAWLNAGQTVASHTVDHPFLNNTPLEKSRYELKKSKSVLEEKLQIPIDFLCYPYGKFATTTMRLAKECNYLGAFAIFENIERKNLNLFALPRIPIPAKQKNWEFTLKIRRGFFMIFVTLRQWERLYKLKYRRK